MSIGRPRSAVVGLPVYRPGKGAAQAEQEHGITDAIKLASNENPLPPLPSVLEAALAAARGANRYADHRAGEVRSRLAGHLGVDVESVTVGCGSVGLLQQLFLTYVEAGDDVVYPWRSFESYPIYTQLMGGTAVTVPLIDHAFDLDGVADAVTAATKMILLATPNNPTGTAVSTASIGAMLQRVPDDVIVVIDEAYREFLDPSFGDPVTDLVPQHPNVVVTRTFSKAHGLAGVRVGYAVGHPELVADVDKTLVPFAVNGVAQAAALAALDARDEIAERVAGILGERARVVAALEAAGHRVVDAQANFVWLPLGAATDDLYLAMERLGVVTRPFSGDGIRVTIGTPTENDRFLATFAEVTAQA